MDPVKYRKLSNVIEYKNWTDKQLIDCFNNFDKIKRSYMHRDCFKVENNYKVSAYNVTISEIACAIRIRGITSFQCKRKSMRLNRDRANFAVISEKYRKEVTPIIFVAIKNKELSKIIASYFA